jgi:RimJ/RimL family protein N-acetyltransferase
MGYRELRGRQITLKIFSKKQLTSYFTSFSSTVQLLLHVTTLEQEYAYLGDIEQEKNDWFYTIFCNHVNELVGAIGIREQNKLRGQLYCWLNEQFWGRGYCQESVFLLAKEYFCNTGNQFFTAHVDTDNKRSYYALKKCGFIDFGIINGSYGKQYILIMLNKKQS